MISDIQYLQSIYLGEEEDIAFLTSINLDEELYTTLPSKPIAKEQQPYKPYGKAMNDLFYNKSDIVGLSGPAGTGKALTLNSLIQTPNGPIKNKDIKIGDIICTPNGTSIVTAIHPQGIKPVFRVIFTGDDEVICTEDHLWETIHSAKNRSTTPKIFDKVQVQSLKDIRENYLIGWNGRRKYWVNQPQPLEMNEQLITVNPYILGVLLGDGYLGIKHISFTSADIEIVDSVLNSLNHKEELYKLTYNRPYGYTINANGWKRKDKGIWEDIKQLGLEGTYSDTKFIPKNYMYNSWQVRLAVLQGLMDTDGTVDVKTGAPQFTSTSKQLAEDVKWIVESFGGICTITTKEPAFAGQKRFLLAYTCYIRLDDPQHIFRLARKKELCIKRIKYPVKRMIELIVPAGEEECQCITIDDLDGLYLTNNCIVTHNSRAELEKLHLCMEKYAGARGFIARKTRESLSESALFTFEEKVVPVGHSILTGVSRRYRQSYDYSNGSQIVVVGLDKPQKLMSTEFDIGYVQEFIECELHDLEMLMTRLRNGVISYNQLIFDCNPDKPEHWIYQSSLSGKLVLLNTYHEDNPILWQDDLNGSEVAYDGRRGDWTEKGKAYIAKLDSLTGSNKLRLRYGKWASSEGVVYPEWSANPAGNHPGHVINRFEVPNEWRRIWVVDFGVNHPFVWHCYAIDDDGRMYCEYEIYMTNRLVQDHAKQMLAICGWERLENGDYRSTRDNPLPFPADCYGDWDKEGLLTLERETGFTWTNAYKSINDGIQEVASRLRCSVDGKPRIQFFRDCLVEEDPILKDKMLPTSVIQEFPGYVWDTKNGRRKGEVPIDKDNHGMDVVRYACSGEAGLRDKYSSKDVPMESMPLARVVAIPNKTRSDNVERLSLGELNEFVKKDSRKNVLFTTRSQRQELISSRTRSKRRREE